MKIARFCLALVIPMVLSGCGDSSKSPEPPRASTTTGQASAAPKADPNLQKLEGKWLRADGDYLLEISEVEQAGKLTARYFNPGPINVSKSLGLSEAGATKVFVELQDTGYPGCTYSLTYDPETDQLFGQYYQAAMQQTYDVAFARFKEEQ